MEEHPASTPIDAQEARPPLSAAFTAILRIFYAPGTVFRDIRAGLGWWPGLIVMILIMALVQWIQLPVTMESVEAGIESGEIEIPSGGDEESLGRQMRIVTVVGTLVLPVLGIPLAMLIIGGLFWLALLITFGTVRFGRIFTLTLYTGFIGILYQFINSVYLRLLRPETTGPKDLEAYSLKFGLNAVLENTKSFLGGFLGTFDLFGIWGLWLFVAGAAVLLARRKLTVLWPVLTVAVILALVSGFFQSLGS